MQKPRLRMTPPESRLNACVELFEEVKFCSYVVPYVFGHKKTAVCMQGGFGSDNLHEVLSRMLRLTEHQSTILVFDD